MNQLVTHRLTTVSMDDRHNNADPVMKQSLLQTEIRLLKKNKIAIKWYTTQYGTP